MQKIAFVCLGNICRSPMAEFVMKSLTDQVYIESRATSNWEHGNPIHRGTLRVFQEHHISYDKHKRSIPLAKSDFYEFDYLIGMDEQNVRTSEWGELICWRWLRLNVIKKSCFSISKVFPTPTILVALKLLISK